MSQLVYQHVHPRRGTDHPITPKRIQIKGGRRRMVCGSCEKFVMMVPIA